MLRKLAPSLIVFASILSLGQSRMPLSAAKATYATVMTVQEASGGGSQIPAEDRQAVADVERALQEWRHYQLTQRKSDADVIVAVRKGRPTSSYDGVRVHKTTGRGTTVGPTSSGDVGLPDDYLSIIDARSGALLWQDSLSKGLEPPRMLLFERFKDAVEKATK